MRGLLRDLDRGERLAVIVAVAAVAAALLPILANDLVWDDKFLLGVYARDRAPSGLREILASSFFFRSEFLGEAPMAFWRPLTSLLLSGAGLVFGGLVPGYHALSLGAAAFAATALFFVARRATPGHGPAIAFFVALVFLAHPVSTDAICMVANLSDDICLGFALAAVFCHLRILEGAPIVRNAAGAAVFGLLACASKESGVLTATGPLFALGLRREDVPSSASSLARSFVSWTCALAPVVLFLGARFAVLDGERQTVALFSSGLVPAVMTAALSFGQLLAKSLVPSPEGARMYVFYDHPASVAWAVAALALLGLWAYFGLRHWGRFRAVIVGLSLAVCWLLPSLMAVTPGAESFVLPPRYFHAPLAGLLIAVVPASARLWERSKALAPKLALAVVFLLALLAFVRAREWRTNLSFWQAEVDYHPGSVDELLHLGWQQLDLGLLDIAAKTIEQIGDVGRLPSSQRAQVLAQRARVLANRERDFPRALALLREARRLTPSDLNLVLGIADVERASGLRRDALRTLSQALTDDQFSRPSQRKRLEEEIARYHEAPRRRGGEK